MSSYNLIVFVHVVSAVVLVGGGLLATPAVHSAIRHASTVSELRRWLTFGKPLSRIDPLSAFALLASGVYLASVGDWWSAAWVQVAVGLWVVNAAFANLAVEPAMARLARVAFTTEGEEIGPELERWRHSPGLAVTSAVMLANDLGVLFLMVTKPPGYVTPFLSIVMAQFVILGFAATRRGGFGRPASADRARHEVTSE